MEKNFLPARRSEFPSSLAAVAFPRSSWTHWSLCSSVTIGIKSKVWRGRVPWKGLEVRVANFLIVTQLELRLEGRQAAHSTVY